MTPATTEPKGIGDAVAWAARLSAALVCVRALNGEDSGWVVEGGLRVVLDNLDGNLVEAAGELRAAAEVANNVSEAADCVDMALKRLQVVKDLLGGEQPDTWARLHPDDFQGVARRLYGVRYIAEDVEARVRGWLNALEEGGGAS